LGTNGRWQKVISISRTPLKVAIFADRRHEFVPAPKALQQEPPKIKVGIECEAVLPGSEAAKPRSHKADHAPSGAATGASKEQGGNGMRSGFA
jgi:hypothetical protein